MIIGQEYTTLRANWVFSKSGYKKSELLNELKVHYITLSDNICHMYHESSAIKHICFQCSFVTSDRVCLN